MASEIDRGQLAEEFVARLEGLAGDRAALARLRRCAGRTLAECPEVYPLFYRLLPPAGVGPRWLEEPCFLVASLFPTSPGRFTGDLGTSLRAAVRGDPHRADGLDRRMGILLDCDFEELPFRLRQAAHMLASLEVGVDWRQLLLDLLQWGHPDRPAQKRWARHFFGQLLETAQAPATGARQEEE
ncbi:MAG: type I-E CRISPR-associated protein Cse2/CasB [Chloroflexota bacterium]